MITIERYRFEGPVDTKGQLRPSPGVYAILDYRASGDYNILDIGESQNVRERVENHDREHCWGRHCHGRICYAALYFPGSTQAQRREVEEELCRKYQPPCGEY